MRIRVKLFAVLKERMGRADVELEVAPETSCQDILDGLCERHGDLTPLMRRSLLALNGKYADREELLSHEDELAILPPVSGG